MLFIIFILFVNNILRSLQLWETNPVVNATFLKANPDLIGLHALDVCHLPLSNQPFSLFSLFLPFLLSYLSYLLILKRLH